MTQEEKLIRARQAAAKARPDLAKDYLSGRFDHYDGIKIALYALDHKDEPIVDPDVIEARKMCAERFPEALAEGYLAGDYDGGTNVPLVLAAIRRGRELERGEP